MQKIFITVVASLLIVFSTFGETESESSQILSSTVSSGSNLDIDGNGRFDALTDGLLVLRSMFGLTGAPLISGVVAADAVYTNAEDIQSRITGLGNLLDIDNNGNVDALTDGLIILRYFFGLTGDTLIKDVVASDAQRLSATDIESHMASLNSLNDYDFYLLEPTPDPEHITGIYHPKHCFFTRDVNGEQESRWLWDAGLTDEQKIATYTESQSITLTNGETVTAECIGDYEIGFGSKLASGSAGGANALGIYGVSQYLRIWDELEIRPLPQAGIWGQWIQGVASHPYFPMDSIEGGLFSDDKMGRSKYPKYMIGGATHLYSGNSSQYGWGFYEKRVSCEYLGGIQIANKLLYPPNLLAFDENQEAYADAGGLFFGHGWMALPMVGGKKRENWTPDTNIDGEGIVRDASCGKLTWTFFVDAKNFSGPLTAFVPEFFYRRLNKFNALELLSHVWEEGESTDTEFLNKVKDYIADRITEDEFESLLKEQSWYVDGVENFDEVAGGDYIVRKKDSLAFNPSPRVGLGDERYGSKGLTFTDDTGTMYLKTFLPKIPDNNNIEPFSLSGRSYGVEYYNNFLEFFNSEDIQSVNLNITSFTTALESSTIESKPRADTFVHDKAPFDEILWTKANIKDANGDPVPNKLSFEASVDVMIEEINNGSNVYWDWKNNANRMPSEYYKVTPADNPEDYIFERVSESDVPETLKLYRHSNKENMISLMPHVKTTEDEELIANVKSDMQELFDAEIDYMDFSCRICVEEDGCDNTLYTAILDDGSKVDYRWYRFKDQPTFITLKKEFPEIYTADYLNALQEKIEHMHSNWQNNIDFLSRPASAQSYDVNLVEIDNGLIMEPPAGKEIGWVPIAVSVEMPGKNWQRELNYRDGPLSRDNWDGTGSEAYQIRGW